jgi:hypothetical protein
VSIYHLILPPSSAANPRSFLFCSPFVLRRPPSYPSYLSQLFKKIKVATFNEDKNYKPPFLQDAASLPMLCVVPRRMMLSEDVTMVKKKQRCLNIAGKERLSVQKVRGDVDTRWKDEEMKR